MIRKEIPRQSHSDFDYDYGYDEAPKLNAGCDERGVKGQVVKGERYAVWWGCEKLTPEELAERIAIETRHGSDLDGIPVRSLLHKPIENDA